MAFYLSFIKLPYRRRIIPGLFAIGLVAAIVYHLFATSSIVIYVPTALAVMLSGLAAVRELIKGTDSERRVLSLAVIFMPSAAFYDLFMLLRHTGDGTATYLGVFNAPFIAMAFILSFGKRTLDALTALGEANTVLEARMSEVRAELSESEAQRRKLVVSQAISSEGARLMQEMHDGIGSNLTTALAVAHKQSHPPSTVKALKPALGDLKLTVDSLEPVDGDLVALIGNLRHRMSRDLEDANMTCKWHVEDCAPLTWLDATNALHVLRIHNEAISNVLAHSKATEIRIGCAPQTRDGRAGIATYVADNGVGFDQIRSQAGKGLANMAARAHSLHGSLACVSTPGEGTTVRLWLPYDRTGALPKMDQKAK